ncbi:MAG TPA: hypothetical protein VJ650_08360 [Gemmatimonadaceae bacterium]|nr:hypothetical protein [Gemmatimonadaceae bacterium]
MSECLQEIQRSIQSYDERDLLSCAARLAEAARQRHEAVEVVIVNLKNAVNAIPASALRERARTELRDAVVRIAIRAYYEGAESVTDELGCH